MNMKFSIYFLHMCVFKSQSSQFFFLFENLTHCLKQFQEQLIIRMYIVYVPF